MNRRAFIAGTFAALIAARPLAAETIRDGVLRQLSAQGFTHVDISNTLLGRMRFVATSREYRREIILNPRTGEILRDWWEELSTAIPVPPRLDDPEAYALRDRHDDHDRADDRDDDDRADRSHGSSDDGDDSGRGRGRGRGRGDDD